MPSPTADPDPWARALVEQNQRWLTAYFLAATGDRATSEDLVQETFRAALESQSSFDPTRSFGAWLRGIARNKLLRHYRHARLAPLPLDGRALDQLDSQAQAAEERLGEPDQAEGRLAALRACLERLTRRAQSILALRYTERQESKRIGEQLGMSANAVEAVLSRARKALHQCVGQRAGRTADG